jgi:hypothetical protein
MQRSVIWVLANVITILPFATQSARALPAFAEQTGQPCVTCHIGGFGPQLTPFGRTFKLNGYTLRANKDAVPLSAMAELSFVHTAKDQSPPPAPHYAPNDNATIDQISAFVAGGFGNHLGAFSQFTYDGVGRSFSWDNLDVRATEQTKLDGKDLTLGLGINNNPTVQDTWATLPAWGFPFTSSNLVPSPAASPILAGAFAQNVVGLSAYAWWNSEVYAEVALYRSLSAGMLRVVGVDPTGANLIDGVAPYARLAYQKDFGEQNFEVGAFTLDVDQFPGRDQTTGKTDRLRDYGADASYQYLGKGDNIVTANARYTHEAQRLAASQSLGQATNAVDSLDEFVVNGSYYWKNTVGLTVSHFQDWGSRDPLLYAGNRTSKPDSDGFIFQLDGTPFGKADPPFGTRVNLRVGLQYFVYTKFNGASANFDGLGRSASDNNALRLFIWGAF